MSIRLSLEQPWKAALFASIPLVLAALLVRQTVLVATAEQLDRLGSIPKLQRAQSLWPDNPDIHYQLGLLRLYTFGATDRAEARKQMLEATEFGPLHAAYWRGLAWACQAIRDDQCASRAAQKVETLAPMDPQSLWFAGNYYLRSREPELALDRFRKLLQSTPTYDKYIFRLCDSLGCPETESRRLFTQSGPQIELDYISYLGTRGDVETAQSLWNQFSADAMKHHFSFSLPAIEPFVDALLQHGEGSEAKSVWRDLEKLNVVHQIGSGDGNLLFNGDFEQPISNAGLDWRQPDTRYALVDMASGMAYHGKRCMRVDFTINRNDSFFLAYQMVPLDPNTRYALSAYVRSEVITSDSGPQLGIIDPLCPSCLQAVSDPTTGTTPWHRIELKFSTGGKPEIGRVQVWRSPSRTYPMDITGVFWLDDVRLTAEGSTNPSESEQRTRLPG